MLKTISYDGGAKFIAVNPTKIARAYVEDDEFVIEFDNDYNECSYIPVANSEIGKDLVDFLNNPDEMHICV